MTITLNGSNFVWWLSKFPSHDNPMQGHTWCKYLSFSIKLCTVRSFNHLCLVFPLSILIFFLAINFVENFSLSLFHFWMLILYLKFKLAFLTSSFALPVSILSLLGNEIKTSPFHQDYLYLYYKMSIFFAFFGTTNIQGNILFVIEIYLMFHV